MYDFRVFLSPVFRGGFAAFDDGKALKSSLVFFSCEDPRKKITAPLFWVKLLRLVVSTFGCSLEVGGVSVFFPFSCPLPSAFDRL